MWQYLQPVRVSGQQNSGKGAAGTSLLNYYCFLRFVYVTGLWEM
jgi:hypothetical protein